MRSWTGGHALRLRWLPTPRLLAVFHRRYFGLPREGYLLTARVPDADDLHAFLDRLRPLPPADRRRALLEEFDRTYAEVQTMIEQRIGVADVAMGNAPLGLAQAFERVTEGGVGAEEAKVLASDVQRLRDHLKQMMSLCDEFLTHLDDFVGRRANPGRK